VSSQTSPTSVRQAISAGAQGYVPKRASDIELVSAVRRIAAGERYLDPALGPQLVVADEMAVLSPLSARERDVLNLVALGYTNQEIGAKLFISVRTVDSHRAHIMRKLQLATRAELVLFALAHGLIGAS
jgi:DNA-binding NarL/FixJ family response regulator